MIYFRKLLWNIAACGHIISYKDGNLFFQNFVDCKNYLNYHIKIRNNFVKCGLMIFLHWKQNTRCLSSSGDDQPGLGKSWSCPNWSNAAGYALANEDPIRTSYSKQFNYMFLGMPSVTKTNHAKNYNFFMFSCQHFLWKIEKTNQLDQASLKNYSLNF